MNKEIILQLLQSKADTSAIFQPYVTVADLSLLADEIITVYNNSQTPTQPIKQLKAGFLCQQQKN